MYQNPFKKGYTLTCPFKKVGSWKAGYHIGVDLVGKDDKKIYPICEGEVQSLNSKGSAYGNHVLIKQNDGRVSLYAHLSEIYVMVGEKVGLNTCIGKEGSTGNSTGSHLHLELHDGYYRYPSANAEADWLIDPLVAIAENQFLTTNESIAVLKDKVGLEQQTIDFLLAYKYGEQLVQKLAKTIVG